jgi:hypothetical protein
MSITDIRAGIETNLETISGLRGYSEIPENPQVPAAVVTLDSIEYHQAFKNGLVQFNFTVTVIVGRFNARASQQVLNEFADNSGAKSIRAAIESDRTLGGTVFDCVVQSMGGVNNIDLNDGNNYLATDFVVIAYAN